MFAGGLVIGAGFWRLEHRVAHPMLPPRFLGQRTRGVAVASAGLMGFMFYGTLFLMSLYFQDVRGWSPGSTGVGLLPLTVGSLAGPFLLYRPLARRYGHPPLLVAGFGCCALGIAALAGTDAHTTYPLIAAGLLLIGIASTIAFSALTSLLIASVPPGLSGLASGVQNTTRQAGALLAVAILGAVLNVSAMSTRLPAAFGLLGAAVVLAVAVATRALGHGADAPAADQ
jgi:DHA2 family methylenomycin A resistance protein-like MFS transporter